MRKDINKTLKISAVGSAASLNAVQAMMDALPLTGNEAKDRRIIQEALELPENRAATKASILYQGNGITHHSKIIKEWKRLWKSGSLEKMSETFYHFCTLECGEIAHYDRGGFIYYFDDNPRRLVKEVFAPCRMPHWRTDARYTLDEVLRIAGAKEFAETVYGY